MIFVVIGESGMRQQKFGLAVLWNLCRRHRQLPFPPASCVCIRQSSVSSVLSCSADGQFLTVRGIPLGPSMTGHMGSAAPQLVLVLLDLSPPLLLWHCPICPLDVPPLLLAKFLCRLWTGCWVCPSPCCLGAFLPPISFVNRQTP